MPGLKPFTNETTPYTFFPHLKKSMPMDQKAKLLAMHKAGRANAGIYVGVVLAVYTILLTILLCRYARRHRSSGDYSSSPPDVSTYQPSCCSQVLASCLIFASSAPHTRGGGDRLEVSLERLPLNPLNNTSTVTQV